MPNVDALLDAMGQVEDAPQDPRAVSPKGARGLYQIMPDTGKQYGVDNPDDLFDPKTNRSTAKKIVTDYAKRYDGDPRKILQAYNAGPERVKSGMVPKETHSYVDKVLRLLGPSEASAAEEPDADYWANATVPGSLKAKPKADTQPAEPDAAYWAAATVPEQPKSSGRFDNLSPGQAEAKRAAVEGGGSDTNDPLVENLTVGLATGGLAPGIDAMATGLGFVPKTVAGKLLNTAGLTAEQYLYGWLGEKGAQYGQEIGGTPGRYIGEFGLPMLGGGIEALAGRGAKTLTAPITKGQEAAAMEAAESAESKLYENAPKQVYEYGEKVGQAQETAAKKATAAKDAANAARHAEAAQQEKAVKQAAEEHIPRLAAEAEQKFFGRTPQETEAVRSMPAEDLALHRANMRNVVFGPINHISEELGAQFDQATKGQLNNPAKIDAIGTTVADESKWLGERGASLSKPVRDLMDKLPSTNPSEELRGMLPYLFSGHESITPTQSQRFNDLLLEWNKANPGKAMPTAVRDAFGMEALGGKSAGQATIGDLLGLRTEATKLVASQEGHNQQTAMELRNAIDQSLLDSGVNIPQGLRERWGLYKSLFNKGFRRNVATAANPLGYGKQLFENRDRFQALWRNASPDEQQSLKQLMGDYWNSTPNKKKLWQRLSPPVLKAMFGDTPYEKFNAWMTGDQKALAWEQYRAGVPHPLESAGAKEALRQIREESGKDVVDAGIRLAQQLGPAGRGKLAKILAARVGGYENASKVVQQEFPISPEAATDLYREAQTNPGKAAFNANRESKQLEKGLDVDKTREAAAVQALMQDAHNPFVSRLKNRLYYHSTAAIGEMALPFIIGGATGHLGGAYQIGMAGVIGTMIAANEIRGLFRAAISDPETARLYWQMIDMKPTAMNQKKFGALAARIAMTIAAKNQRGQEEDTDDQ